MASNLKRMFGYFECPECYHEWQSSHVYCDECTEEAEYGQECDDCGEMCKPVSVEELVCSVCDQTDCSCVKDQEYDPDRAHRSDLCEKCQSGDPCF